MKHTSLRPQKQTYEGVFDFDPGDPIYKDHFPGHPVVPGSLIIQAFVTAAQSFPVPFKAVAVENFRFRRFVAPGKYPYRLEQHGEGEKGQSWRCSLLDGDQVVASGVLT